MGFNLKVNGVPIIKIGYADDTVLLTIKVDHLQILVNKVTASSEEYGLSLNVKKTKIMLVTKTTMNIFMLINLQIETVKGCK